MKDTTPKTLARALAYVAITGNKRALHMSTRGALFGYTTFHVSGHRLYDVTPEGMALAKTSDMWKAHEALLAAGFKVNNTRKHKPGFISYFKPELVETKTGKSYSLCGFISSSGTAYAEQPSDTTGSGWDMKMLEPKES